MKLKFHNHFCCRRTIPTLLTHTLQSDIRFQLTAMSNLLFMIFLAEKYLYYTMVKSAPEFMKLYGMEKMTMGQQLAAACICTG